MAQCVVVLQEHSVVYVEVVSSNLQRLLQDRRCDY